jgi:hypothetical protein
MSACPKEDVPQQNIHPLPRRRSPNTIRLRKAFAVRPKPRDACPGFRSASSGYNDGKRMKYWIDTEFIATPYTIDLISVGLVAEDGREFYAESDEVDWSKANLWTLENVRPKLTGKAMKRQDIGNGLRLFTDGDERPVFWGYFPAYDWVAFIWLFGSMDELPFHYPQLCLDIKQWAIELGDPELPHQVGDRHNALLDARWTREAWAFLARLDPAAGERRATGGKNPNQFGRAK